MQVIAGLTPVLRDTDSAARESRKAAPRISRKSHGRRTVVVAATSPASAHATASVQKSDVASTYTINGVTSIRKPDVACGCVYPGCGARALDRRDDRRLDSVCARRPRCETNPWQSGGNSDSLGSGPLSTAARTLASMTFLRSAEAGFFSGGLANLLSQRVPRRALNRSPRRSSRSPVAPLDAHARTLAACGGVGHPPLATRRPNLSCDHQFEAASGGHVPCPADRAAASQVMEVGLAWPSGASSPSV